MRKKGFTLIETVIAVSLSSIILLTGVMLLSTILRTFNSETKNAAIRQIHEKVISEIAGNIQSADHVSITGNKLTLSFKGYSISYELISNKVRRQKGNSTAYLTDTNEIKNLSFQMITPGFVEILTDIFKTEAYCRNE